MTTFKARIAYPGQTLTWSPQVPAKAGTVLEITEYPTADDRYRYTCMYESQCYYIRSAQFERLDPLEELALLQ